MGRDLCCQLGIVIDFEKGLIKWNEAQTRMKNANLRDGKVVYAIDDSRQVQLATKRVKKILDAKYEKANLVEVVRKCTHLSENERVPLLTLLRRYEPMFDGTLGQWRGEDFKIELKEGVKPYYSSPYPVPKIHEETMKKECARMETTWHSKKKYWLRMGCSHLHCA